MATFSHKWQFRRRRGASRHGSVGGVRVQLWMLLAIWMLATTTAAAEFVNSTTSTHHSASSTASPATTMSPVLGNGTGPANNTGGLNGTSSDPHSSLLSAYISTVSDDMDWMYRTDPGVANTSLADYCFSTGWSKFQAWLDQTTLQTATNTQTNVFSTETSVYSTMYLYPAFAPAAQVEEPCCGPCQLFINSAQVYYFPEKTAGETEGITSFVSDSMTFVSPSVYVRWAGMGTHNMPCVSDWTSSTTIVAYPPGALSTILTRVQPNTVLPRVFTTVPYDFANVAAHIPASCTESQSFKIKETGRTTVLDGTTFTGPTCSPNLVFPASLHTEYTRCSISIMVFDPPMAFTKTSPLNTAQQTPEPAVTPESPAASQTRKKGGATLMPAPPLHAPGPQSSLNPVDPEGSDDQGNGEAEPAPANGKPQITPPPRPLIPSTPSNPSLGDPAGGNPVGDSPAGGNQQPAGPSYPDSLLLLPPEAPLPPSPGSPVSSNIIIPPNAPAVLVANGLTFHAINPATLAVIDKSGRTTALVAGGSGAVVDREFVYLRADNALVLGGKIYMPDGKVYDLGDPNVPGTGFMGSVAGKGVAASGKGEGGGEGGLAFQEQGSGDDPALLNVDPIATDPAITASGATGSLRAGPLASASKAQDWGWCADEQCAKNTGGASAARNTAQSRSSATASANASIGSTSTATRAGAAHIWRLVWCTTILSLRLGWFGI